jgi:hypothetical protein
VEQTSALVCIPAPASTTAPNADDESGSGSGDDVLQPNLCNCGSSSSHPVCWVDQLVTLPSLCIARCLNIQHVLAGACPSDDEGSSLAVSNKTRGLEWLTLAVLTRWEQANMAVFLQLNERSQTTSSDDSQKDAILIALTAGLALSVFVIIVMVVARRVRASPQPRWVLASSLCLLARSRCVLASSQLSGPAPAHFQHLLDEDGKLRRPPLSCTVVACSYRTT